jgi:hypothetical protein
LKLTDKGKDKLIRYLEDYFKVRVYEILDDVRGIPLNQGDSLDLSVDARIRIAEGTDPDNPKFESEDQCTGTTKSLH